MERFADDLAAWLVAAGHRVVVLTRTESDDSSKDPSCAVPRRSPMARALRITRSADVVHVNGLSLRGIALARAAGVPAVVTHQGHQAVCPTGLAWTPDGRCSAGPHPGPCGACPKGGTWGRLAVQGHRVGARIVAQNVAISRYLRERVGLTDAEVIYNPVSSWRFSQAVEGAGTDGLIGFSGRLVAEKGIDLLLRAIKRIPDTRLEVAGDGPLRARLERLTHGLGIAGRVRFLGRLDVAGVAALYARAAVVCVPSVCYEAYGYAAAEAMAMGRAVVATPRGALPELLGGGRGFLANAAEPSALPEAVSSALGNTPARVEAGRCAARFAREHLHIDVTANRYVEIYRRVAG